VTGPDTITAKLMTGKPLRIVMAIGVVPHGVQPGLAPVKLHGAVEVDPIRDDLAVKLVELRSSVKTKVPKLAGGLKVASQQRRLRHALPAERQGLGFALSLACFFQ
jgi:hypothetical protein